MKRLLAFAAMTMVGCAIPPPEPQGQGGSGGSGATVSSSSSSSSGASSSSGGPDGGPMCITAADCPPTGNACSSPLCTFGACDITFVPLGQGIGAQTVGDCLFNTCDGAGNPITVPDDSDIPNDSNACTIEFCSSGQPSSAPHAAGTPCGVGLVCDGMGSCVGCLADADCGVDTVCVSHVCQAGTCAQIYAPLGTGNLPQVTGDCKKAVCNGTGGVALIPDDADIHIDANACTADLCNAGVVSHPPLNGTSCGQGLVCYGIGCVSGCVINGLLYPPGAFNQQNICQKCDPQVSTTAWSAFPDGTVCGAGSCVTGAQCLAGTCTGTSLPDGTACNDNNPCTSGDTCAAGVCSGTPYSCGSSTSCTQNTCDGNGGCMNVQLPNGTPCPDAQQIPNVPPAPGVCNNGSCYYGCFDGVKVWPFSINAIGPVVCQYCNPSVSTALYNGGCHTGININGGCSHGICYFADPNNCDSQCADCSVQPCDGNALCYGLNVPLGTSCADDNNPCTTDQCNGGKCYHISVANGTSCGPGMTCSAGMCQ